MIAELYGKIIRKNPPVLTLDVNGVGYEIFCPMSTFYHLDEGQQHLYTQLIVREDSHTLYGFFTQDEKIIFNTLIKVSGIGAKVALAILSTFSIDNLILCVMDDNVEFLQRTPGIGKKTAQKLMMELKDSLPNLDLKIGKKYTQISDNEIKNINLKNAMLGLKTLGFKKNEARRMLADIDTGLTSEEIIRLALKHK